MSHNISRIAARTVVSLSALAILLAGGLLFAGPLNPAGGPVTSTYKTLNEIEPRIAINATNTPGDANSLFKIVQPGSYYLTGNITGATGKHGIEIAASGVTLDLNGFDLVGVADTVGFDGISVEVVLVTDVAVSNGSVRNWGHVGVNLLFVGNTRIDGVHASNNGANGEGGGGIASGIGGTVTNCSAYANSGFGISANDGSVVTGCSATGNVNSGFFISSNCTLVDCSASLNGVYGVNAGFGCTIINCAASENAGIGIASGPATTVSTSVASENQGDGIVVRNGSVVNNCVARRNLSDGIRCESDALIAGNACSGNGYFGSGAGVHATGSDNRIEGNNCTNADRGIDVDGTGNVIVKNSCSGNTSNWDIVVGNAVAQIVAATVNSGAIVGDVYAGTLGSTDPNANLSY